MPSSRSKKSAFSENPVAPQSQKNHSSILKLTIQRILLNRPKFIKLAVVIVLLVSVGSAAYFYTQYQKAKEVLGKTAVAAEIEQNDLVERVGKLMELPSDEQPTVATVTDANKLKAQQFFLKAQNGDRVLIYPLWKKAILYRLSTNKIIEVSSVDIGSDTQKSVAPTVKPETTVSPQP